MAQSPKIWRKKDGQWVKTTPDVTKADVGLGNVENYGKTDSYKESSTELYVTAKAVHDLYNEVKKLREEAKKSRWESGDIKIHHGTLDDIPDGWVLCDGNNGTPPMVDRAVVGAGGKYGKNQTFGSDSRNTANHTLSTSQMPSHNHKFYGPYGTRGDGWGNGTSDRGGYANLWSSKNGTTTSSGGSGAHSHGIDTRQASIAVIWIMKL